MYKNIRLGCGYQGEFLYHSASKWVLTHLVELLFRPNESQNERPWEDASIIHTGVSMSAPQFGICVHSRNQSQLLIISFK